MEILTLILSIIAIIVAFAALNRARSISAQSAYKHPPAAPHPTETVAAPTIIDSVAADTPPPQILAVIAATVASVCGPKALIAGVQPVVAAVDAGIESATQLWALEGRRAIHATRRPR